MSRIGKKKKRNTFVRVKKTFLHLQKLTLKHYGFKCFLNTAELFEDVMLKSVAIREHNNIFLCSKFFSPYRVLNRLLGRVFRNYFFRSVLNFSFLSRRAKPYLQSTMSEDGRTTTLATTDLNRKKTTLMESFLRYYGRYPKFHQRDVDSTERSS